MLFRSLARKSDFRLGYENFTTWWMGDDSLVGFRRKADFDGLDVADHECTHWAWEGDFSLGRISVWKRLRWAFSLVPRYLGAFRALFKHAKGPAAPPSY